MKGVTVLGSTGSIGVNTLDVVRRHDDRFRVTALSACRNVGRMADQCAEFNPRFAVMAEADAAAQLEERLRRNGGDTTVLAGVEGLVHVAEHADTDYVMAAIVGAAGLLPAIAAAAAGKRVMLANKEALVMAGKLFMDEVRRSGAELLPVDSEHNAVFQCLPRQAPQDLDGAGVRQIVLTASGGPFRGLKLSQLAAVTPEQACAHPNWVMGRKISVDSASMMNKGLEVIEACWLFGASVDRVNVLVHPQSVVHSMVEYADGSLIAQLGSPDMRTPIAHALAWPARIEAGVSRLNLVDVAKLEFENPDTDRFPCLRLAYDAMRTGGVATAVLNAANEVAVEAFLTRRLPFTGIAAVIESTLGRIPMTPVNTLDDVLAADTAARDVAQGIIRAYTKS